MPKDANPIPLLRWGLFFFKPFSSATLKKKKQFVYFKITGCNVSIDTDKYGISNLQKPDKIFLEKNKTVKDKSVFIAADGIETGWGNKIPLWLFGFLY